MSNPFEQVSAEEAAKELNMNVDTLREAMQQGTFPFPLGYWIQRDQRRAFWIYRGLLDQAKDKITGNGGT